MLFLSSRVESLGKNENNYMCIYVYIHNIAFKWTTYYIAPLKGLYSPFKGRDEFLLMITVVYWVSTAVFLFVSSVVRSFFDCEFAAFYRFVLFF